MKKIARKPGRFPPLVEEPLPPHVARDLQPGTRAFRFGKMSIFLSRHHNPATGEFDGLWHLSIDGKDRYPTWDEMVAVRYTLIPADVTMAMPLPPRADYINLNEHVFQITEVPAAWLRTSRLPQGVSGVGMMPTALRDYSPLAIRKLDPEAA